MAMLRTATICAVLLSMADAAAAGDDACVRATIGTAPAAVAAYIRRRLTCLRYGGDEPISRAQAHSPKTPAAIRALNCDRLDGDDAALRREFAHDRSALQALTRSERQLC